MAFDLATFLKNPRRFRSFPHFPSQRIRNGLVHRLIAPENVALWVSLASEGHIQLCLSLRLGGTKRWKKFPTTDYLDLAYVLPPGLTIPEEVRLDTKLYTKLLNNLLLGGEIRVYSGIQPDGSYTVELIYIHGQFTSSTSFHGKQVDRYFVRT